MNSITYSQWSLISGTSDVTFNKGITQTVMMDGYANITCTMKKDFSFVKLSDTMKVRVQGLIQAKRVVKNFEENGYTTQVVSESLEHDYVHYIFTKNS